MAKKTEADHLEEARSAIMSKAVAHAGFDGWTGKLLRQSASEAEVDLGLARLAFPRGAIDMIERFWRDGDRAMSAELEALDLPSMKIRERVATAVKVRFRVMSDDREAARRAAAHQASPIYSKSALESIYRTVDDIWFAAGDTSTDYNFYTKRLILSGVYISSFVYWQGDHSDDFSDTEKFIDRRIEDVMQFEKVKAKARGLSDKLPSPLSLLSQIRSFRKI